MAHQPCTSGRLPANTRLRPDVPRASGRHGPFASKSSPSRHRPPAARRRPRGGPASPVPADDPSAVGPAVMVSAWQRSGTASAGRHGRRVKLPAMPPPRSPRPAGRRLLAFGAAARPVAGGGPVAADRGAGRRRGGRVRPSPPGAPPVALDPPGFTPLVVGRCSWASRRAGISPPSWLCAGVLEQLPHPGAAVPVQPPDRRGGGRPAPDDHRPACSTWAAAPVAAAAPSPACAPTAAAGHRGGPRALPVLPAVRRQPNIYLARGDFWNCPGPTTIPWCMPSCRRCRWRRCGARPPPSSPRQPAGQQQLPGRGRHPDAVIGCRPPPHPALPLPPRRPGSHAAPAAWAPRPAAAASDRRERN